MRKVRVVDPTMEQFPFLRSLVNNHVGRPYCQAEMYAGHVACWPLVSRGEYVDGTDRWTDGRTPDRYIMLYARRG